MDPKNPENLDGEKTGPTPRDIQPSMLEAIILSSVLAASRYFLAVLVVCLAFLSLHGMARETWRRWQHQPQDLLSKLATPECTLDTLPPQIKQTQLTLSGQAKPNGKFTLQVNEKVFGPFYANQSGRFEERVTLARQSNSISLKCEKEKDEDYERTSEISKVLSTPIPPLLPEIRNVTTMPDGRLLLVGIADAETNVFLIGKGQDRVDSSSRTDQYGIFELIADAGVLQRPDDYELEIVSSPSGKRLAGSLKTALSKLDRGSVVRTGRLDLTTQEKELELEITAPVNYPYFTKLLAGDMAPERLVDSFFSSWKTTGESRWKAVTTSNGKMTVRVHTQILSYYADQNFYEFHPASSLLPTENDTFTLTWDVEQRPRWFEPMPTVLEPRKAVWKGELTGLRFDAGAMQPANEDTRATTPPPAEETENQPTPTPPPTLRQLLRGFSFPALISPFAHGILIFLPFGWLLYTLFTRKDFCAFQSDGRIDVRRRLRAVILILGVLALRWPASVLIDELEPYLAQGLWFRDSTTAFLVIWLAFISAIPLLVRHLAEKLDSFELVQPADSVSKLLRPIILRGVAGLALIAGSTTLPEYGWFSNLFPVDVLQGLLAKPLSGISNPAVLAIFVVLFAVAEFSLFIGYVLIWLAGAAASQLLFNAWQPDYLLSGTIGAGATILVAVIPPIRRLWYPDILGKKPWHRFTMVALLFIGLAALDHNKLTIWLGGVLASWASLWLCLFLVETFRAPARQQTMEEKLSAWGLYLLTAILCYPSEKVAAEFWRVGYLLNHLNSMSKYLALLVVLVWLYRESKKGVQYERDHNAWLATSLFAFFLVGSAAYVLYIPVPLLVAYLIANQWLIQPATRPTVEAPGDGEDRKSAIEKLIHTRWLRNLLWNYTRTQDKKLQKGEMTLSQHAQALAEFKREARLLGYADRATAEAVWRSALNNGPNTSAWKNAMTAVKYAFPLAMALVFLEIYQFTADEWNSPYPILAFVLEMSLRISFWLSIAWFFGYFYRYIRGTSGLSKGLSLSLTIVVPYLCLDLLSIAPVDGMNSFFIWAGQILLYTTVLGLLAFDYETLRLCGLSWPQLTAIYRIPTLSAFGSVLVGALVSILLAVLEGKTLNFANFALSFISQLFPDVKVDH